MSGTAKKWLIGCGLGCGFMAALGLGLGAAGWYGVRHVAKRAHGLEAAADSLSTRFGAPESYAPPADGHLAADRLDAFLEARRLMAPVRDKASHTLAVLDGSGGGGVPARIVAGVNFVPQLLAFIEARNRALLNAGMGAGEYKYIYTVAFFGLLGKDPGDGPGFLVSGNADGEDGGRDWTVGTRHRSGSGNDAEREKVRRERADVLREKLNRVERQNLRRQLEALDADKGEVSGHAAWRAALAAEVEAMDNDRRRLPWEKGLPEATRASLEPFRDRFEASYDAMTGALELHLDDDDTVQPVQVQVNGV